jgi:hypothetical protein
MGSDGLGTQAEEGSQDPRLRRQDGLVRRQIRPWLSYGIMIMKFSFICIGTVFLVLLLSLLRWRSCFRYHSIPSFHHKGTPEVLTSSSCLFSDLRPSISISRSRGFSVCGSSSFPSCFHAVLTLLLVFEPCMILPCISSLGLFLLIFRFFDEEGLQCLFSRKFVFMGYSLGLFALVFCFP